MTAQKQPLTSKMIRKAFGISPVTLYLWRKDRPQRNGLPARPGIPVTLDSTGSLVGDKKTLEQWAKKHCVEIKVPFDQVMADPALYKAKVGRPSATSPTKPNKSNVQASNASDKPAKTKVKPADEKKAPVAAKKAPAKKATVKKAPAKAPVKKAPTKASKPAKVSTKAKPSAEAAATA